MAQPEPSAQSRFVSSLDVGDRGQIDLLEGGHRATRYPNATGTGLLGSLRTWQWLIAAMEGGWVAPETSTVHEYLDELTARDRLDGLHGRMRNPLKCKFEPVLHELDERFRTLTFHDGGEELAQYWRPLAEGTETRWYWLRRPIKLPAEW